MAMSNSYLKLPEGIQTRNVLQWFRETRAMLSVDVSRTRSPLHHDQTTRSQAPLQQDPAISWDCPPHQLLKPRTWKKRSSTSSTTLSNYMKFTPHVSTCIHMLQKSPRIIYDQMGQPGGEEIQRTPGRVLGTSSSVTSNSSDYKWGTIHTQ